MPCGEVTRVGIEKYSAEFRLIALDVREAMPCDHLHVQMSPRKSLIHSSHGLRIVFSLMGLYVTVRRGPSNFWLLNADCCNRSSMVGLLVVLGVVAIIVPLVVIVK